MSITQFCNTQVTTIHKEASLVEAAKKMREQHVGDLIVCDEDADGFLPLGILTDRDIVVGAVALDISPGDVCVEDVMTPSLVTVKENSGVSETIHLMEAYGVRRVPVLDANGRLLGIVSSGDLLELLGQELVALSKLSSRQIQREEEVRIS